MYKIIPERRIKKQFSIFILYVIHNLETKYFSGRPLRRKKLYKCVNSAYNTIIKNRLKGEAVAKKKAEKLAAEEAAAKEALEAETAEAPAEAAE